MYKRRRIFSKNSENLTYIILKKINNVKNDIFKPKRRIGYFLLIIFYNFIFLR
jgi:hypothetical protein